MYTEKKKRNKKKKTMNTCSLQLFYVSTCMIANCEGYPVSYITSISLWYFFPFNTQRTHSSKIKAKIYNTWWIWAIGNDLILFNVASYTYFEKGSKFITVLLQCTFRKKPLNKYGIQGIIISGGHILTNLQTCVSFGSDSISIFVRKCMRFSWCLSLFNRMYEYITHISVKWWLILPTNRCW